MTKVSIRAACFLIAVLQLAASGCAQSWHTTHRWVAEEYFDDPQVVALCHAIEANDLAEMERLVATGADVNALGKGNMTPLLWAYPDNKLERFSWLLEHGADPNVIFTDDFGLEKFLSHKGTSITHLASGTWFPGYFDAVFAHGGDPNLLSTTKLIADTSPMFEVIRGLGHDKRERIARLIALGADLNHVDSRGVPPAEAAISRGGQYDLALQILEAGADFRIYRSNSNQQLVHTVILEERVLTRLSPERRAGYDKLVSWLKDHGASFEDAREDLARWRSGGTSEKFARIMKQDVEARKRREARAAAAAEANE